MGFNLELSHFQFCPYHFQENLDFKAQFTEYKSDIMHCMMDQERYRERLEGASPQLKCRSHLVDLLEKVCLRRNFTRNTLHLAVYLLDLYMEFHNISLDSLNLVAVVALCIAAKFEETENFVPKYTDIHTFITLNYPPQGI